MLALVRRLRARVRAAGPSVLTASGCDIDDYNAALTHSGSPASEIRRYTGRPPGTATECAACRCRHHGQLEHLHGVADLRRKQREGA